MRFVLNFRNFCNVGGCNAPPTKQTARTRPRRPLTRAKPPPWQAARPLLTLAITPDLPRLREALDAEVRAEQEKDRIYWEPLKREMEEFRRAERASS
jgi:hypothetical protein